MNDIMTSLIHGHLDGVLTAEQEAELNAWLKADASHAAQFAEIARIHDSLRDRMMMRPVSELKPPRRRVAYLAGLAALAAAVMVALYVMSTSVSAASELDRLIDRAATSLDRVYRIDSLDPNAAPTEPRQPPIDGAILSIRSPDKYVLARKFPDGRPYITGSDGERNWDIPQTAPVRLSRDPLRFRWPLPGHQHGIPFADLRSDLVQLRDAYRLQVLPPDARGWRGLRAEKKSREYPGPNRVDLWYDATTGVIHRMIFDGLPRARGGPKSVAVELLEQRELPADYFQHEHHHAPDRRVIEED